MRAGVGGWPTGSRDRSDSVLVAGVHNQSATITSED